MKRSWVLVLVGPAIAVDVKKFEAQIGPGGVSNVSSVTSHFQSPWDQVVGLALDRSEFELLYCTASRAKQCWSVQHRVLFLFSHRVLGQRTHQRKVTCAKLQSTPSTRGAMTSLSVKMPILLISSPCVC